MVCQFIQGGNIKNLSGIIVIFFNLNCYSESNLNNKATELTIDNFFEIRTVEQKSQIINPFFKTSYHENLKEIGNFNRDIAMSEILNSSDIVNILKQMDKKAMDITNVKMYEIDLGVNDKVLIYLIGLNQLQDIIYMPSTKLKSGTILRSFAKLSYRGNKFLFSENGYLYGNYKRKILNSSKVQCETCVTFSDGSRKGEVKDLAWHTDWSCVRDKQGRCAFVCGSVCAVTAGSGCTSCITACEASAIYDCTSTVEECFSCDKPADTDMPLPGDLRIKWKLKYYLYFQYY